MTIERYKVGRTYTERTEVSVSGESLSTPEGAREIKESLEAACVAATLEGRIAPAIHWAAARLENAGMPLDFNAPVYSEQGWRRQNARRTDVWYAIKILEAADFLRTFTTAENSKLAAQFAMDLAELVTEARFIFGVVIRNAVAGGIGAKASDKRRQKELEREAYRQKAAAIKRRNPSLTSKSEIARRIDPTKWGTIRRWI